MRALLRRTPLTTRMACRAHNPALRIQETTRPNVTITQPACTCIPDYSAPHQSSFHTFTAFRQEDPTGKKAHSDKKQDLMDKDSINTTSSEYSKTGQGDGGAAHEEGAFDPERTSPDQDGVGGAEQHPNSSLNVSPGNKDINAFSPNTSDAERSDTETSGGRKSSGGGLGSGKGGRQPGR